MIRLVTVIAMGDGGGSGVDVLEQSVGMAKSGDDLMRWQSIARGERRSCRPRTFITLSIN